MSTNDLYWNIETLYSEGIEPNEIARRLHCDAQIVFEILADMGEGQRPRKPKRGKIAPKMRDDMGYS